MIDNAQVIPPEGHPLRAGYDPARSRIATAGDRFPSDLDDVFPTVQCRVSTGAEIVPSREPVFDPLAEESFINRLDDIESGGINYNPEDDDESEKEESGGCGTNNSNTCVYEIEIGYIIPQTVTTVQSGDATCHSQGPCRTTPNPQSLGGKPCTGQLFKKCHQFSSRDAALARIKEANIRTGFLLENCRYIPGQEDVYQPGPAGVTVLNPPPPPPCKNKFFDPDCGGIPINCGSSSQGFSDPSIADEEVNQPAEAQ